MAASRTIALFAMPGVQLLDLAGPLDVFAEADVQARQAAYRLLVVGETREAIVTSSGVRLMPDRALDEMADEPVDTLLIAGAPGATAATGETPVAAWLRTRVAGVRRYGSVCTGAFVLAAAGLLDGRRVTTHWAAADTMRARFPAVDLDEDAIYVRDGRLRTAAGVTAGLDLALALVEEDLGRAVAMKVASQLVMFFKRPGGQMQFSRRGEAAPAGRSALQEVQRWIAAHPAADHSVRALAERMKLSPRHFARLFRTEIGTTPAAWVEAARVEAARRLLESGTETPKRVAVHCGFADVDTLRRAFVRQIGVTPAEYRKRHAPAR
jgi:transcriptional regulator GlxA family with amidase domain